MSKLATEEMTPCPSCGDLTFAIDACSKCKAKSSMLFDTAPFDLPTAFERGYEAANVAPLDMLIFCPECGKQHIDQPEPEMCKCSHSVAMHTDFGKCVSNRSTMVFEPRCPCQQFEIAWNNPPHKSHTCRRDYGGCGIIFRVADVPTNGVAAIKTRGKDDTWPRHTPQAMKAAA